MTTLTPELERQLRESVNPAYADVLGTASHERAAMLGEIDRLRDAIKTVVCDCGAADYDISEHAPDCLARELVGDCMTRDPVR